MSNYREVNGVTLESSAHRSEDKLINLFDESSVTSSPVSEASPSDLRLGIPEILYLGSLIVFPFLFGGRDPVHGSIFKSLIFFVASVTIVLGGFSRDLRPFRFLCPNLPKLKALVLFFPFSIYLALQLVPLPMGLVSALDSFSINSYQAIGESFAYLSVDPMLSRSAAFWIFSFLILYSILEGVPLVRTDLASKSHRTKKSRKDDETLFSPEARTYDLFSEVMQTVLIRLALVCGVLGVLHVIFRANYFLGIFSFSDAYEPSSRAHFPFVNANQLAIFLEVGLMLSFGRFLRDRQLKRLVLKAKEDESLLAMVSSLSTQLEKQATSILTVLVIALSLVLTMSRTGIVLSMLGLTGIWFAYRMWPVVLVPSVKASLRLHPQRVGRSRQMGRWKSLMTTIIIPLMAVFAVFSMLGSDSTNTVVGRFDRLYVEGGDVSRSLLNSVTEKIFYSAPFLGVGLNSWRMVAPQFAQDDLAGWMLDYAHNEPFQLLSEIGLVGMALLLIPVWYGIMGIIKFFKAAHLGGVKKIYICFTFMSFLIPFLHSFVDFPFHSPALSLAIFSACYSGIRVLRFEKSLQD